MGGKAAHENKAAKAGKAEQSAKPPARAAAKATAKAAAAAGTPQPPTWLPKAQELVHIVESFLRRHGLKKVRKRPRLRAACRAAAAGPKRSARCLTSHTATVRPRARMQAAAAVKRDAHGVKNGPVRCLRSAALAASRARTDGPTPAPAQEEAAPSPDVDLLAIYTHFLTTRPKCALARRTAKR